MAEEDFCVCLCVCVCHTFFIHSSIDGHLGCFHNLNDFIIYNNYLIIIKAIIMDIHIKMGFATYFPEEEEDVIIKIQWFEKTKYAQTGYRL